MRRIRAAARSCHTTENIDLDERMPGTPSGLAINTAWLAGRASYRQRRPRLDGDPNL